MNQTRYTAKDLRTMTLGRLAEIGKSVGLTFGKNHTKQERAKRILVAYAESDVATPDATPGSSSPLPPVNQGGPKPRFEELIDGGSLDLDAETQTAQRGGARPGAGRPEGMTDEISAYNRLSKQPHPVVKMTVEKLFDAWANRVGCAEIRLTKEEAVALALPWTHAYELSPLSGRIPPWLMVVCNCTWSTFLIVDGKARIARETVRVRALAQKTVAENLN